MKSTAKRNLVYSAPFKITAIVMAVAAVLHSGNAALLTWDGGGADDNWTTAANWSTDVAPAANDSLSFDLSIRPTPVNNYTAGTQFNGLTFAATAGAFTLSGNSINLAGGVNNASVALQTVNLNLALTATQTFTTTGGGGDTAVGGIISGTTFGVTKVGSGTLTLSGTNTYTGATSISAGTLKNGSATAFTNKGAITLSGTGTFDLGGFNAGFTNFGGNGVSTNTITNNGSSDATLSISAQTTTFNGLIQDGTKKTAFSIANSNSGVATFTNASNTFSGGVTLLNGGTNGTRLRILSAITTIGSPGAITSSQFGTGAITIGTAITDKAQILFDTATNITLANALVFNTNAHLEGFGVRVDTTGLILSGTQTANLADAGYSVLGNNARAATITGKITGSQGLKTGRTSGTGSLALTLNSAAGTNDYAGNTTIGANTTVILGAADQISDGAGKGNVVVAGTLNVGSFSETINGLSGAGTIDSSSSTPTLSVGNNNATGATNTFTGVIQNTAGTLALAKIGNGTLIVSGANTYTGGTTVTGGVLLANTAGPTNSATGTGAVIVNAGGTLGGLGRVAGATTINLGGVLAPGVVNGTADTLTIGSGVTLGTAGAGASPLLQVELLAGNASDSLAVNGAFDLNNPDALNLLTSTTGTFTIATFTSVSGTFDSVFINGTTALLGSDYTIAYNSGNIQVTVLNVVPEPSTWAMMLGSLGMVAMMRRRRLS